MQASDKDQTFERWLVRVSGRVQGIGYRDACVVRARELGVTGWVRNRIDRSVEAMLQGSPGQLDRMCRWLRDGIPAARVDELEVAPVPLQSPLSPQLPLPHSDDFVRLPTV